MERVLVKEFLELIFSAKLHLLDFFIIGLGSFLLIYQILKRITTFAGSFYKKAQKDPLYLTRTEVKLGYMSNLIEILPIMGILGTVWALKNALGQIAATEMPTIKDIATEIAPALSTTFYGLLFAVTNLIFFNFLQAYFTELIAWCKDALEKEQASTEQDGANDEKA